MKLSIAMIVLSASVAANAESLTCIDRQPDGGYLKLVATNPFTDEIVKTELSESIDGETLWLTIFNMTRSYQPNVPYELQLVNGQSAQLTLTATEKDHVYAGKLQLNGSLPSEHMMSCSLN